MLSERLQGFSLANSGVDQMRGQRDRRVGFGQSRVKSPKSRIGAGPCEP